MTRTQQFLLSVLIVVSVPLVLYAVAPRTPEPILPPSLPGSEMADLSGHWQGLWEDGSERLVYSFHIAHRRPEGFVHATGTVMRIRDGFLVDSMLTLSLGGRANGDRLELGAPPPWTRQTVTGSFTGTLSPDGRHARGEAMGLGGTVLPLRLRLVTPALDHAEGAYSLPDGFLDS